MSTSTQDSITQLPDLNVPESEKKYEYHKKYVQAITNQSLHSTYDLDYQMMNQCFEYYQGTQSGEEFTFLQESVDGEVLPAKWVNYNKIKVKMKLLEGELAERGYDIRVTALNRDAKVRKLDERTRLKTEMQLQPTMQALEQQFGLPIQTNEFIPKDDDELEEYMDYTYKEKSELIMESALKYLAKRNRWEYERVSLFRDVLIAGRCFAKSEIVNGLPRLRRIDPRFMIFDTNAKDDFLSDASYFGEVRYMNVTEAAEEYQLTTKELKEAYQNYSDNEKQQSIPLPTANATASAIDGSSLTFFKQERGELRVLIVTANWCDHKTIAYKESVDKFGGAHYKNVKDTFKGENVTRKKIQIWRKATLIAGEFLKHWGEVTNQVRDDDSLEKVEPQYKCLIPDYFNGNGISLTNQLKGLQDLKNISLYNVQLAMARAGAKGFVYDIAQLPESWDIETALKYLKVTGIAFIDSQKDGMPSAQFNQFQTVDMTLSDSVQQYISISSYVDQEMDAITGINEARQGIVKNASQAVGVTQSALLQSNLATSTLFKFFNSFTNTAFQHQAGLVKISWAGKERYAPIIGDAGVDFLSEDIDLSLDTYGVFVEETPKMLDNMDNFTQLVQAALQAGQIDFLAALKLMQETDIKLAIRRFEKEVKKQQKVIQEQQAQEQQAQQELAAQAQQAQSQDKQMEAQVDMGMQQATDDAEMQRVLAKGRIDLAGKRIDLRKDIQINANRK